MHKGYEWLNSCMRSSSLRRVSRCRSKFPTRVVTLGFQTNLLRGPQADSQPPYSIDMYNNWFWKQYTITMPKIIGHTPSWLSQPSPGARIFSDPEAKSPASPSKRTALAKTDEGSTIVPTSARRLTAHRGSEVFTVIGNKIRWADLSKIKDDWEAQSHKRQPAHDIEEKKSYRVSCQGIYKRYFLTQNRPSKHRSTTRLRT